MCVQGHIWVVELGFKSDRIRLTLKPLKYYAKLIFIDIYWMPFNARWLKGKNRMELNVTVSLWLVYQPQSSAVWPELQIDLATEVLGRWKYLCFYFTFLYCISVNFFSMCHFLNWNVQTFLRLWHPDNFSVSLETLVPSKVWAWGVWRDQLSGPSMMALLFCFVRKLYTCLLE